MIELLISKTCKFAPRDQWQGYDNERKSFPDIAAAKAWISDTYGKSKRMAMYRDRADGGADKCGYVICFRPAFRSKGDPIYEQHWVEFHQCTPFDPTEKEG